MYRFLLPFLFFALVLADFTYNTSNDAACSPPTGCPFLAPFIWTGGIPPAPFSSITIQTNETIILYVDEGQIVNASSIMVVGNVSILVKSGESFYSDSLQLFNASAVIGEANSKISGGKWILNDQASISIVQESTVLGRLSVLLNAVIVDSVVNLNSLFIADHAQVNILLGSGFVNTLITEGDMELIAMPNMFHKLLLVLAALGLTFVYGACIFMPLERVVSRDKRHELTNNTQKVSSSSGNAHEIDDEEGNLGKWKNVFTRRRGSF